MPDLDTLKSTWGNLAERYSRMDRAVEHFPLEPRFFARPGDAVLDAGCGAGTHLAMFKAAGHRALGVDISLPMLRHAREHGQVCQADVRTLPFGDEKFDYVFSMVVINYLADWPKAMAEMARVLKTGGRCVVVGANSLSFLPPVRHLLHLLGRYALGRTYHTSLRTIVRAGGACGLTVVGTSVKIKEVTAEGGWRRKIYTLVTDLDRLVNRVLPWWGGDAVVMFQKGSR